MCRLDYARYAVCLLKEQRVTANYGLEIRRELLGVPQAIALIAQMRAFGHTLTITDGGRDVFALSSCGEYTTELLFPETAQR